MKLTIATALEQPEPDTNVCTCKVHDLAFWETRYTPTPGFLPWFDCDGTLLYRRHSVYTFVYLRARGATGWYAWRNGDKPDFDNPLATAKNLPELKRALSAIFADEEAI